MHDVSLTLYFVPTFMAIVHFMVSSKFRQLQSRLRQMAKDTFSVFTESQIFYWIDFGTLLGIIREGDIILYDNDIDVCVLDNADTHTKIKEIIAPKLGTKGYTIKKLDWDAYRIYNCSEDFVDVYLNKVADKQYIGATGTNSNISKKLIGTPFEYAWKNTVVMVPEHIHETLEWRYGSTYLTPRIGFKGRDS